MHRLPAIAYLILFFGLTQPTSYIAGATGPVEWGWTRFDIREFNQPFVQVAAGDGYSVGVRTDGKVAAWGNDQYGQCQVPSDLANVVEVAVGYAHTLALQDDGTVLAWGADYSGVLDLPPNLGNVVGISSKVDHNLALRDDGTVVGWGNDFYGQASPPEGLSNVTAIAAGGAHSLALMEDGTVVAWGWNEFGQADVPDDLGPVRSIAAGNVFSVALKEDGSVVMWGAEHATYAHSGFSELSGEVIEISAGFDWTAALRRDGRLVAWYGDWMRTVADSFFGARSFAQGNSHLIAVNNDGHIRAWAKDLYGNPANRYGEANNPHEVSAASAISVQHWHTLVLTSDGRVVGWGENSEGQTDVPEGLTNVKEIAAGFDTSMALKEDGTVLAWGRLAEPPFPLAVPRGLTDVVKISSGARHKVALKSDGEVVVWGTNQWGQLNVPDDLAGVASIAAGVAHTLALTVDGTVVAWGYNSSGQTDVPEDLDSVIAIAAGYEHSLALREDGSLVGWGQLGNAGIPEGLGPVTAINAGAIFSIVLTEDGEIVAWRLSPDGPEFIDLPANTTGATAVDIGARTAVALVDLPAGVPVSFAPWLAQKDVPPARRGISDDPAADGVQNLLSYLFNIDPLVGRISADANALPQVQRLREGDRDYLTMFYRHNRSATGIRVAFQVSDSMEPSSWETVATNNDFELALAADPLTGDPVYRIRIEVTDEERLFARLKVELE